MASNPENVDDKLEGDGEQQDVNMEIEEQHNQPPENLQTQPDHDSKQKNEGEVEQENEGEAEEESEGESEEEESESESEEEESESEEEDQTQEPTEQDKLDHPKLDKDQLDSNDRTLHVSAEYESIIDTSEPKDIQELDLSNLEEAHVLKFKRKQSKSISNEPVKTIKCKSSKVQEKKAASLTKLFKFMEQVPIPNRIHVFSRDPRFSIPSFRKSLLEWAQDKHSRKGIDVFESLDKIGAIKHKINLMLDLSYTMIHQQGFYYRTLQLARYKYLERNNLAFRPTHIRS